MNTKKFSIWFCGIASLGLSTFTLVTYQPYASAATLDGTCNDLKNSAKQADNDAYASFLNSSCQSQILPQGTSFFRYYSFPPANDPFPNPIKPPGLNTTGRYLTTNFFDFNSEAIVKLALYPFTPAFQNFAYYRETVTLLQDTELYVGTVGPQLPNNPTSCYAGGAAQYYINAGVSNGGAGISPPDGTIFKYSDQEILPKIGYQYKGQYGVGDPCQKVPEPSPLAGIGAIAALGLAAGFNRELVRSKTKRNRMIC